MKYVLITMKEVILILKRLSSLLIMNCNLMEKTEPNLN